MAKRAFAVVSALGILFCALGARIVTIDGESYQAAASRSSMTFDIASLRGTVYDCNMKPLTNSEYEIYAAAKPTNGALAELKKVLAPEAFDSVMERMSKGKPVAVKVESIGSCPDIKAVTVPKRYSRSLACHLLGYLNSEGDGVSGIEKAYNELLNSEISLAKIRFYSNAKGKIMLGEDIEAEGCNAPKTGVVLTIDKEIQRITENALDFSGAECAAAVVMDIKSGAIRACVSRPAFDRDKLAESLADENSPLINRALLPFSVGSVFKPVVAAAALEIGIGESFKYNCTGSVTHNGVTFNCHKEEGHGELDMRGAVAVSCNTYFIALAIKTGRNEIIETAKSFGFGSETELAEGMVSSAGYLPESAELDSKAAIANISFGQGLLLATPVQICAMISSIAGSGVYVKPYLIEGQVNSEGEITKIKAYAERRQIISDLNAEKLCGFLEAVVTEGSGKRAASEFVTCGGKTATAQTGKSENGEEIYNAWFAGYFPVENPEYAIAILKENGGEGAISCAPVFKEIAEGIVKAVQN